MHITVMLQRSVFVSGALLVTILLFGGAALLSSDAWWGVNHLKFLPVAFTIGYATACLLVLYMLAARNGDRGPGVWYMDLCRDTFARPHLAAGVIAVGAVILFVLFRLKTYFLGDGYNLLALFSTGDTYYLKWTEPGATLMLRFVQKLMGGYSRLTVQQAFVVISIASGAVTVVNMVWIARRISPELPAYSVALPTLLFSGSALLFFGYLEFYPFLWAVATSFLNAATYYLATSRKLWLAAVLYGLTVIVHLQAIMWAPAAAVLLHELLVRRHAPKSAQIAFKVAVGICACVALVLFVWQYQSRIEVRHIFLPLFSGRVSSPDYGAFTAKHLGDILNLLLLLSPGVLTLLACLSMDRVKARDSFAVFFSVLSIGSIAFVLLVDPDLGLARDWDLMSLSLLAPILLLLRMVQLSRVRILPAQALSYALITLTATTLYIASEARVDASEARMLSLLEHYGSKNCPGWVILSSYYADQKNWEKQREVNHEMQRLFPDEVKLVGAWEDLDRGNYEHALTVARQLYDTDPQRSDYMQVYGQALAKNKQYARAAELYSQAMKLRPYHAQQRKDLGLIYLEMKDYDSAIRELSRAWRNDKTITAAAEGVALAYIYKRQYDSAHTYAQQLFDSDPNSPGAHLIEMTIALNEGDMPRAKRHYEQYSVYGSKRSDYNNILSYYGPYFHQSIGRQ